MAIKLILDIDETTWKEVLKHKIECDFKNNNQAVVSLIQSALKKETLSGKQRNS